MLFDEINDFNKEARRKLNTEYVFNFQFILMFTVIQSAFRGLCSRSKKPEITTSDMVHTKVSIIVNFPIKILKAYCMFVGTAKK